MVFPDYGPDCSKLLANPDRILPFASAEEAFETIRNVELCFHTSGDARIMGNAIIKLTGISDPRQVEFPGSETEVQKQVAQYAAEAKNICLLSTSSHIKEEDLHNAETQCRELKQRVIEMNSGNVDSRTESELNILRLNWLLNAKDERIRHIATKRLGELQKELEGKF